MPERKKRRRKEPSPQEQLDRLRRSIITEVALWLSIREYGCQDPFWPDGCNMNLVRNHVLAYKMELGELCKANGLTLPAAYYQPTPPEVDEHYMADLKSDRADRLRRMGEALVHDRIKYDADSMSLL